MDVVTDAVALMFVVALTMLGWYRGLLAQVVPMGAAFALWWFFDLWYPPLDGKLAALGPALSEYPSVRRLVGGALGWFGLVVLFALLEALVIRNIGLLEAGNRGLGAVLGLIKGVLYGAVLIWIVETIVLWGRTPDRPVPDWITDSALFEIVGPWNPVRVYTLREVLAKGTRSKGEQAAAPVEETARARALFLASPVRKIIDETASTAAWEGTGYVDMVSDPRVREVLGDDQIGTLLFGD